VWTQKLSASAVQGPHIEITYVYDGSFEGGNVTIGKFYGTSQSD
jgi:hypothetical protein